jgi:hypothetical protein
VPEALEHLVGLQAQVPLDPYTGLAARLDGFDPLSLSRLVEERVAVRISLMRATIHLVTADDCVRLCSVMAVIGVRGFWAQATFRRELEGIDVDALLARGRELLDAAPRTPAALGRELAQTWPDRDPAALALAIRYLLPLAQVPPRGQWNGTSRTVHAHAQTFLARPLDEEAAPDDTLLRYLAAFGPATTGDMRTWSGLVGIAEVVARLRPRLRSFRDERGRELLDVPDGLLPDPETPAPPRFLPGFDNAVLSHDDRSRIISAGAPGAGRAGDPTFLVDGFAAGGWKLVRRRGSATLVVTPARRLTREERRDVKAEAEQVLELLARGAAGAVELA